MTSQDGYLVRLAESEADHAAALRLRYRVFVEELGANGPLVDHQAKMERDEFDLHFDHLVLIDRRRNARDLDHVVGVYRLLPCDRMSTAGRFYSETEFDLSVLKSSGRRLLELGRSCVDPLHRGGTGMFLMWNALAGYVLEREIDILFGAASLRGTDVEALNLPLSYLYHNHLAPELLRVRAIGPQAAAMDRIPKAQIDRREASANIPALIKAYLRLGGFVGDGAYVDHAFNTTDVCLVMDTERMSAKHRDFYTKRRAEA